MTYFCTEIYNQRDRSMDGAVLISMEAGELAGTTPWGYSLMEQECCLLKKCCKAYKKKGKRCKKCPKK